MDAELARSAPLFARELADAPPLMQEQRELLEQKHPLLHQCLEAPHARWVVSVEAVRARRIEGYARVELRWRLTRIGHDGVRSSFVPPAKGTRPPGPGSWNFAYDNFEVHEVTLDLLDFAHDGEPEVAVTFHVSVEEGVDWSQQQYFRAHHGQITPLPINTLSPAHALDVDGDGHLDVVYHGPYVGTALHCGGVSGESAAYGPELLAHGRGDGTFSLTDGAAQAVARSACEGLDGPFVTGEASLTNLERAACARLRGESADSVRQRVRAVCGPTPTPELSCREPTCLARERLKRWIDATPPLTVR